MSGVRWCDPGGHPFSDNDAAAVQYLEAGNFGGEYKRKRIDICGPHASGNSMNLKSLTHSGVVDAGVSTRGQEPAAIGAANAFADALTDPDPYVAHEPNDTTDTSVVSHDGTEPR